eukprot:NODE_12321_length_195_cov_39.061644_g11706_i0.p2 GENE.NODE_12321_length_195_cov_39.061644_g11706_i0~~NODE_12321_length_195_cov_39.061644_g11706_i0.p2  ORF type:complete len:51 (-),score=22.64 NODE_12321_length_195_cov_39.061644_g11706_i0:42-164(-)
MGVNIARPDTARELGDKPVWEVDTDKLEADAEASGRKREI